jgi:RNA polymerase sigma factor (sigma-70 family)
MASDDAASAALSACLDRLATGDLDARGAVIEACSERLRTLASRMLSRFPHVRRWDDTDDVFQNAAMRLHRALGQVRVDSPREVMALAATQIHRELIDLARHHAGPSSFAANHETKPGRPDATDVRGPAGPGDLATAPSESLDRWSLFHEAIDALPAEDREIFHLVWYMGADQKMIARLLDCSERTVKTRWRRARDAVRTALDDRSPEST